MREFAARSSEFVLPMRFKRQESIAEPSSQLEADSVKAQLEEAGAEVEVKHAQGFADDGI